MPAVDPYRLIINDDFEKLYQALCRGLDLVPGIILSELLDELKLQARGIVEEWEDLVESEGAPAARQEYAMVWGCIGAIEARIVFEVQNNGCESH